jgi:hypothetical protein
MSSEPVMRFYSIRFVLNTLEGAWEEGIAALTSLEVREGHCRVPATYVEGTFSLGQWTTVQRRSGAGATVALEADNPIPLVKAEKRPLCA